jgi:peptidoglycan hydrolase CwlO-like protein
MAFRQVMVAIALSLLATSVQAQSYDPFAPRSTSPAADQADYYNQQSRQRALDDQLQAQQRQMDAQRRQMEDQQRQFDEQRQRYSPFPACCR